MAALSWTGCRVFDRGNSSYSLSVAYLILPCMGRRNERSRGWPSGCVSSQLAAQSKPFTSTPMAHSNATLRWCWRAETFPGGKWGSGGGTKGRKPTKAKFTLESFTLTLVNSSSILCSFRHNLRPLEYVICLTADEGWLMAVVEGKNE